MARISTAIAGLTAVRLALGVRVALSVPGPLLSADDLAYMSLARTLAGQGEAPIGPQPPYGFLYPVLLAPGWLLGLGEPSILRWARVVNAVLAAAMLPALYLLARRVLGADRRLALLSATIGSILPAGFLTASLVWTENLLPLLVVLALLAVQRLCGDAGRLSIAGVLVSAVALFAAHPRMAPVSATLVVTAVVVLIGRVRWTVLWGLIGSAVVALSATEWVRRVIQTATFGGSGTYSAADLASRRGPAEIPEMVVHSLGAVSYLVLAGAGLAVVGAVVLWRSGVTGRVAVAVAVVIVATAGWFLTGVQRSDSYLHGRYIEVIAPVLVAAGIVGFTRLRPLVSTSMIVGGTILAGIVAAWAGPGDNWASPRSPVMMFGVEIIGAPFGSAVFEPGAVASVALLIGVGVVIGMRRPRLLLTAVAIVLLVALGVRSGTEGLDGLYDSSTAGAVSAGLDGVVVDRMFVADSGVPGSIAAAVAWRVGFDSTAGVFDDRVTHLLLSADASPPEGATKAADFGAVVLWDLG